MLDGHWSCGLVTLCCVFFLYCVSLLYLHGELDICKSKAGKFFTWSIYSNPNSDNTTHQVRKKN